ncbi:hypothetical protein PtB15_10B665 [Puccinia triticina]|nr:hypothetical protein PtB15_10B665 [Puccinia triticina]
MSFASNQVQSASSLTKTHSDTRLRPGNRPDRPSAPTPTPGQHSPRIRRGYGVVAGEGTETCTAGAGSLLLEFATLLRLVGVPIYEVRPTRDRLAQAGGQYNLIDCTPSFKRDVYHLSPSGQTYARVRLGQIRRIAGSIHPHHRQGYLITPTTNAAEDQPDHGLNPRPSPPRAQVDFSLRSWIILSFPNTVGPGLSWTEIIRKYLKHNPDQARKWLLVQLPLKASIGQEGERRLTEAVSPQKDVNGFHAYNLGLLSSRGSEPLFNPCTPAGVIRLIDSTGFQLSCKHAVVLGRSDIVGTPVCSLLRCKNATVTQCHRYTQHLPTVWKICRGCWVCLSSVIESKLANQLIFLLHPHPQTVLHLLL